MEGIKYHMSRVIDDFCEQHIGTSPLKSNTIKNLTRLTLQSIILPSRHFGTMLSFQQQTVLRGMGLNYKLLMNSARSFYLPILSIL